MAVNAAPALGDGPYYEVVDESLVGFRPLAELLAPAKGTIPGIAPYQKIVTELAAALEAADGGGAGGAGGGAGGGGAGSADGGSGALPTLASTLSATGTLTLNKLTGADKDRVTQVSGWLTGANIDSSFHEPFLLPVESVYVFGTADINRAIAKAWTGELSPVIAPLLARFPFRVGAKSDAAIADLDVLRAQGKQPGAFWTAFQRWFGTVTVQRNNKYQWLTGLTGPAGALTTINDVGRLSRALWDADGNPTALPIKITPQPLDGSAVDERVPVMAYLRSGSSAVYAFNQRPVSSTLALQWWEQGVSSLILEMRKPGATETSTFSVDEAESPFSFYRLLCRSRSPTSTSPQTTAGTCEAKSGARVWEIPLDGDGKKTRSVTLTLDADPWALFQIGR
jgi:type VI secretion system protein ImpL